MRITTLKRTCALGMLAALSLGAATYRYTYTGNDFTTAFSPYTQNDYVSVTLDFAAPLDESLDPADISGQLLGWSMTDQVQDFSAGSDELLFAVVGTDGSGDIDQWQLVSCASPTDCQSGDYTIATYNVNNVITDSGTTIDAESEYGLNSDSAGMWTESIVTPEPASAILLLFAIPAIWAGKRARESRLPNQ